MITWALMLLVVVLGCIGYIKDSEDSRHKKAREKTIGEQLGRKEERSER